MKLAAQHQLTNGDYISATNPETVQYAECIEHTGKQWTVRATWERLENGVWVTLELPLENY